MPAADPAIGLSGLLNQERQAPSSVNLGSADLSRAARSLESVQGNVAGQTMAVNMLASQTQQAVGGLAMQMSMLATQLNSLGSSISRLGGGMQMSAPPVMPMAMQPPPMMHGGGGFQMPQVPVGAMAGAAFGGGMAGMGMAQGFGGFFGRAGASAINPFMGTSARRTSYGAELDPNAGMFRSAMVGTGMGVTPGMMRTMHGGRIMDAGVDRAASGFGNTMIAMAGGGAGLLTSMAGDAAGGALLGPAMGLARGGMAAGLIGGMAGHAALAPVTMAIGETMRQTGVINQFGDQYRKNSFRFQGDQSTRGQRVGFGSEMNKLAINDATFTERDIQDIFGSAVQNDMMRGAGNASDVARRMRELTKTVKEMGRTMGTTVRETLANMSEMQAAGIDPSQAARMSVLGASVRGLTSGEGAAASMRQAQRMSNMGLGAEGFGLGAMSANIAQSAIGSGRLRSRDVAALGGREGAQDALGNAMGNFMQSGTGMAMMGAGYQRGGGFNMSGVGGTTTGALGRASANSTPEMLLEMTTRPQELQAKMLKDQPAMLASMAQQIMSQTETLGKGSGVNKRTLFMNLLGQQTGTSGAQLEGLMRQVEEAPGALRGQQRAQSRELGNQITSRTLEDAKITPKIGQALTRPFSGAAEGMAATGAWWSNKADDAMRGARNSLYGLEDLQMGGKVKATDILRVAGGIGGRGVMEDEELLRGASGARGAMRQDMERAGEGTVLGAANDDRRERNRYREFLRKNDGKAITEKHRTAAKNILNDKDFRATGGTGAVASAKLAELKEATDPERKRQLMREYMNLATSNQYDTMLTKSPGVARAIEEQLGKEMGINIPSIMLGRPGRKFKPTAEDEAANSRAVDDINDMLKSSGATGNEWFSMAKSLKKEEIAEAAGSEDMQKLLGMLDSGSSDEINAQAAKLTGGAAELWKELGVSGLSSIKGSLSTVSRFEGDKAMSARAQVAGSDMERILSSAGVTGEGMTALGALAKGDVGMDTIAGLGKLKISPEQMKALKANGVSDSIQKALSLDSSGKGLEQYMSKEEADAMRGGEGGFTAEELGSVRLSAMMGEGIGGRVTMGKGAGTLSAGEAKTAGELATQMERIGASSLQLAIVVDKLAAKVK